MTLVQGLLQVPLESCSELHPNRPASQLLSLCRRNATSSRLHAYFPEQR
jgi:hypothetical protein